MTRPPTPDPWPPLLCVMIEVMRRIAICLLLALTLSAADKKSAKAPAPVPAAAPQKNDEGYTAKIRQYTTEPFFLTELVDHLPASDSVPTPEKVLGYAIGTPNKLTYTKDIYRYMRELEKASKRVKVFTIGHSEEGREIILVAVSEEATLPNWTTTRNSPPGWRTRAGRGSRRRTN